VASLSSAAIVGALEGMFEDQNPIRGIFDSYYEAGTGFLSLGGPGATPWQRSVYAARLLDFTDTLREDGIEEAMERYATAFFHQETIDSIWKLGGIYDLTANANQIEITTNAKGETVKRIYLNEITSEEDKQTSNYIDLSLDGDKLMGRREGNVTEHCEYELINGKEELRNGEKEHDLGNGLTRIDVKEGFKTVRCIFVDSAGNELLTLLPARGEDRIKYDPNGKPSVFRPEEGISDEFGVDIRAFEQNGINQSSGEVVVYNKNTSEAVLSLKVENGILSVDGNVADVERLGAELIDFLASVASEKYYLASLAGKTYNTAANMYNERKQQRFDDIDDYFRVRYQEYTDIKNDRLNTVYNLFLNSSISEDEYSIRVSDIEAEYDSLINELRDSCDNERNEVDRIYPQCDIIPLIGDFNYE
jgi:hypothetical protein